MPLRLTYKKTLHFSTEYFDMCLKILTIKNFFPYSMFKVTDTQFIFCVLGNEL